VHEVKHDGYRLQIHTGAGRVRLFTRNGADWTQRYPLIVHAARRIKVPCVIDAEVICTDADDRADFGQLHSRCFDHLAIACAFDLLRLDGDDLRRSPLVERKKALRRVLRRSDAALQYVEHVEGDGDEMFDVACKLGLEGIVCKKLDAPYKSGPFRGWIKVKNPAAPAYLRMIDATF
jgi:bifunctional non-homologous end joining protein LigD